jgi:hypothetical protein
VCFILSAGTWKGLRENKIIGHHENAGPHDITLY